MSREAEPVRADAEARGEIAERVECVVAGEARLSDEDALALLAGDELLRLGAASAAVRERMVPGRDVTFIVDRNVNYTNVCVSGCKFCAFYASPGADNAYVLSREELAEKVAETIDLEGTAILLQGGMHPDLGLEWYEQMLADIKQDNPGIHVHGFGPPEIAHIARLLGEDTSDATPVEAPQRAVEAVRRLASALNLPSRLREFDIGLDEMIEVAGTARSFDMMNYLPRVVSTEDIYEMIKAAY